MSQIGFAPWGNPPLPTLDSHKLKWSDSHVNHTRCEVYGSRGQSGDILCFDCVFECFTVISDHDSYFYSNPPTTTLGCACSHTWGIKSCVESFRGAKKGFHIPIIDRRGLWSPTSTTTRYHMTRAPLFWSCGDNWLDSIHWRRCKLTWSGKPWLFQGGFIEQDWTGPLQHLRLHHL